MLSPKQIGTICFAISILFSAPSFADPDISSSASSADCKYNPLETYSGTSNLQADWTANEISLYWYNNNTLMEVDSTSSDCTYDSTLTPPSTIPTRTGYTFTGWKVRPQMDFSTIPTTGNGTFWAKGTDTDGEPLCLYNTTSSSSMSCDSDSNFDELQEQEWKVQFTHGTVYGMSGCGSPVGTRNQPGTPTIGTGGGCWCKATGYKPTGASVISAPSVALSWVSGGGNYTNFSNCERLCSTLCGGLIKVYEASRIAVYTPAQ